MIRVIRSSACRTKSRTILSGVGGNEILLLGCFEGTLYESSLRMTSEFQSHCIRGALINNGSFYDWRRFEKELNSFPNFRTLIDGLGIHFVHACSPHPDALPILLTHGWPGSIAEFIK